MVWDTIFRLIGTLGLNARDVLEGADLDILVDPIAHTWDTDRDRGCLAVEQAGVLCRELDAVLLFAQQPALRYTLGHSPLSACNRCRSCTRSFRSRYSGESIYRRRS
jgi:hypothetical protein